MVQDPKKDIEHQTQNIKNKSAVEVEASLNHKRTRIGKNSIDKQQKL